MIRSKSWRRAVGASITAALLGLAACGGEGEGPGESGQAAGDKAAARDPAVAFLDGITAFNEADAKSARAAFAPNAAWWNPTRAMAPARGIGPIIKALAAFKAFIPDSRIAVRRVLRRGNNVVAQAVVTGTKRWTDRGTEEDPKRIGFDIAYFVLADGLGRARETLVYFDAAVPQRQTGALKGEVRPVPTPPADKPEIVGAPGADGAVGKAEAVLAALGRGGEGLQALVSEDFTYFDTSTGKRLKAEELPAFLAARVPPLIGATYQTQQSIAAGQFVAVRWEGRVHYTGGGAAEPAEIAFHGAHVFTLADGRISSAEAYTSSLELLEKTGLLAQSVAGDIDTLGPRGPVAESPAPTKKEKP